MESENSKLGLRSQKISLAALAAVLLNLSIATQPTQSWAVCQLKVDEFENVTQPDRSVFSPIPRETLRPLIRASRAMREGDRKRAVELLGELLSQPLAEDYLVPVSDVKGAEGVNVSLRARAQNMLGSLTPDDRHPYRLRYGTQAKVLLEQGVTENDFEIISRVMERFFYTEAGFSAAMLLGHHHLDQGRPIAAANCFQRIVESLEAQKIHDPAASVLLATSWMLGDSPNRATAVLEELKSRQPKGEIEFEGKTVPLFAEHERAAQWLSDLIGGSSLKDVARVDQWVMFGGNPQRNANSGNGFPLIDPLWVVPVENHPDREQSIVNRQQELIFSGAAPIPAVQPLAIGDTIVVRSFDRMIGINFSTGKRNWFFPPWQFNQNDLTDAALRRKSKPIKRGSLTERMWQDSLYGQSSSDGETIFVVSSPGFSKPEEFDYEMLERDLSEPIAKKEFNELRALSVGREGAFKWEVGGLTGLNESQLAKTYFLGAPLPLAGALYAVCQQDQQIKLVVLDPETGSLQWSQQLVSVEQSVNVVDDPLRRLAGASPSFADGTLVCRTGAGAIVAVDLSSRTLRWGYQFMSPGKKNVARISPDQDSANLELNGLWREATIVIADGCVLHTPADSQNMICIDLQTGYPKWKTADKLVGQLPRGDSLYLACAEFGNAVLVGPNSVRAVRLSDGFPVWELETEPYGRPSGRGYANQGFYYLPMTSEQLLQINLETGNLVETVATDGVLGNLICHHDAVISHGVTQVSAYWQHQPATDRIRVAEESGELTPELMALKSQLEYQSGNLHESATLIAAAYDQTQHARYARALSERVIELVQMDYEYGMKLANQYQDAMIFVKRREFEAARINGLIESGELRIAFDELLSLLHSKQRSIFDDDELFAVVAEQTQPTKMGSDASPQLALPSTLLIRTDYWIRSRLAQVVNLADVDLLATLKSETTRFLARQSQNVIELHDRIRVLPTSLVLPADRILLVERLVAENESLRAGHWLSPLQEPDVAPTTEIKTAIERLKLNMDRPTSAPPSNSSSWNEPFNEATARYTESEFNQDMMIDTSQVLVKFFDQPQLREYKFRFYSHTGEFEVIDGYGKSIIRLLARQDSSAKERTGPYQHAEIRIANNLLLLNVGVELFVMDWSKLSRGENGLLWNISARRGEHDQSSTAPAKIWGERPMIERRSAYETKVFVSRPSANGICYLDGNQLICVDPYSGETCWQRANFQPRSMLYGSDDFVVVWSQHDRLVQVFEIATGRQMKQMKLDANLGALWSHHGHRLLLSRIVQLEPKKTSKTEPQKHPQRSYRPFDESDDQPEFKEDPTRIRQNVGLYDLFDEKFVWDYQYPFKTVACRVEGTRLAVLPPSGQLEFVELATGEKHASGEIGLTELERQHVQQIGYSTVAGVYFLHLQSSHNRSNRIDRAGEQINIRGANYYDWLWQGHLQAIDRATLKPRWQQAVRLEHFQVARSIPYFLPFYVLVRRYDRENDFESENFTQFILIDVESGQSILNHSIPFEYQNNNFRFQWKPKQKRLGLQFVKHRLTIDFAHAADALPRPVASLTNESTIPMNSELTGKTTANPAAVAHELDSLKQLAITAEGRLASERAAEAKALALERD